VNYNPLLNSLIQIFDGYTRFDFKGQTLFFRHFCLRDHNQAHSCYEKYKSIAINKGIEEEAKIFERLKQENDWNDDDDLKMIELKEFVSNLKKSKQSIVLPSQRESHQKLIDEEESKLNFLQSKKSELVGTSAEQYAEKMANEEFIRLLIYEDKELKKNKFSEEDFGELCVDDILYLNNKYFETAKLFSDDNIQEIVLQDFFNIYMSCCENPHAFFGKFIHELSAFQMKLLLYGKVFYNIFQYNEDIPEDLRKNPKEIFSYLDAKKNRENFEQRNGDSEGTMVFGATKKDLEILDPSARKLSLSEMLQKNGGSLSMDQMMDLMGN
jgi:hypothetical protein